MIDVRNVDNSDGHLIRRLKYYRRAQIPRLYEGRELKDLQLKPDVLDVVVPWLADVRAGQVVRGTGVGLLIHGLPGRGKTTVATAVLTELIMTAGLRTVWGHTPETYQELLGLWTTYADFLSRRKDRFGMARDHVDFEELEWFDHACHGTTRSSHGAWDAKVLVLDDVGKEYSSTWSADGFDQLLRSRFVRGYPTIITTNTTPEEWGELYNDSMSSFASEAFVPVHMVGRDRRRPRSC